jgi:DNA-binding NarL/FixJ family response regulator
MPVMDGVDTVQALRAHNLRMKVLMLTISRQEEDLMGAIVAGADGYLLKNAEPEELHRAIIRVTEGQSVLSPEVTGQVLHALTRSQQPETGNGPLSDRELEVLAAMAHGLTTYQIGVQLFISENTVKTHIRHILEKLESANRTEAVSKAIQMGLIQRTE